MSLIYKEILNLARHQRSWWLLLMAFVLPLILFYGLFRFTGQLLDQQMDSGSKQSYKVAWIATGEEAQALKDKLKLHLRIELIDTIDADKIEIALQSDSIALAIVVEPGFDSAIVAQKKGKISLHYHSMGQGGAYNIAERLIVDYRKELSRQGLESLNIPPALLAPIEIKDQNYFNTMEFISNSFSVLQRSVAGLLALLLLGFGYWAARYTLFRLFLKEQEAKTIQLLAQGVKPMGAVFWQKFFLGTAFVFIAMLLALMGFYWSLHIAQEGLMLNLLTQLRDYVKLNSLLVLAVFALPFAALLLGTYAFLRLYLGESGWASWLRNLFALFLFILLLIGAGFPEGLRIVAALIPFANSSILCTVLISGKASLLILILAMISSAFMGLFLAWLASMRFKNEAYIFK